MAKITIDPITRIEGHLKIEVELEDGKVKNAWSSGTMARGFEALLKGKDPRDAPFITSRFCGVCYSVHQLASARALDAAFGANVPWGGTLLRNLVMGAQYIYDHPLHFYQLSALDYIDIMAIAKYNGKDKDLLAVKDKIVGLVTAKDTYPLTPRYEPDAFSVNDPDIVIMAVKHYIDALKMHLAARNMGAIWGGRTPHYQNIVVGGVTSYPDINQVARFRTMLDEQAKFINEVYIPDVLLFGTGPLLPLAKAGIGGGHYNYLSYGDFQLDAEGKKLVFPAGVITGLNPANIKVDPVDTNKITESVKHAWYKENKPVHPYNGEQVFNLDKKGAYSFVKAPRYEGKPMEVGPLARMLVAKNPTLLDLVGKGVKPGAVARHAARAIETKLVVDACYKWCDDLLAAMTKPGFKIHDTEHWEPPSSGMGAGFSEPPRGALGHWIKVKDKKIANYQCVVPSTWNASPRCENGVRGQYEEALIGAPVPDPKNPINVVRVIRSFDPCLACAVHIIDPKTNEIRKFIIE
ncbi:MAG: nickel-dependent hydrogenase large subunit [Thermodesulfovibrionales bacterium]|nr:nickel-dependent hydrogenase large subunit [Nitrospinota bacterium]MCG2708801.1 nickel-dependent hydrogenase large subunit [Thermodesulfovibrionales bacterium]